MKYNVHGNGFLQLQINERQRIHIWHPSIPKQKYPTPIHDHKFSFHSTIIFGRLLNVRYSVDRAPITGGYRVFMPGRNTTPNIDAKLVRHEHHPDTVRISECSQLVHGQYETYHMPSKQFHETIAIGPTVTLMNMGDVFTNYTPRILCPVNQHPDNEFNRLTAMELSEVLSVIMAFPTPVVDFLNEHWRP